jgi:hypothetical protein
LICNSCGTEFNGTSDICDGCLSFASKGTYAICVKCDKISWTYIDLEGTTKRVIYSTHCLNCSGKIPDNFYDNKEDAEKQNERTNDSR